MYKSVRSEEVLCFSEGRPKAQEKKTQVKFSELRCLVKVFARKKNGDEFNNRRGLTSFFFFSDGPKKSEQELKKGIIC